MAIHDFIGGVGVFFIVGTYLALQVGKVRATQKCYSVLNALGATLVLVSLYYEFNMAAALVEGFWLAISLYGMVKSAKPELQVSS